MRQAPPKFLLFKRQLIALLLEGVTLGLRRAPLLRNLLEPPTRHHRRIVIDLGFSPAGFAAASVSAWLARLAVLPAPVPQLAPVLLQADQSRCRTMSLQTVL